MGQLSINRATFRVTESDLEYMALEKVDLPSEFQGYQVVREGVLDNETLSEQGFAGNTGDRFHRAGRVTGYTREFGATSEMMVEDGFNFLGGTVAHLFDTPESVSGWMHDIFLKDFEENVGVSLGQRHELISAQRLEPTGFFDESVGLKVLQGGSVGALSSTIIDFRVGRILGVAYVGTVGDQQRLELASKLALDLEKRIVQVVLGAA